MRNKTRNQTAGCDAGKAVETQGKLLTGAAPTTTAGQAIIEECELLRRLPISRRTCATWREQGLIPFIRLPGSRRVLYHWPTVEAALLRRQKGLQ